MKKINNITALSIMTILLIMIYSCRLNEDDLIAPSFPVNPNVFIDDFSAGLDYAAFGGSDYSAFDIDFVETYGGSAASMRFAVPDFNAAEGSYAGGVYFVESGRDLSGYTALTFYAKASKSATIDVIGFGNDLGENKYEVSVSNLAVNTNWKKYYIPIPDPSKLTAEKGMLYYAEGPENGEGYTFWIDEVKFENIGLLAHPAASIMGGVNIVQLAYAGVDVNIDNIAYSINLPNGVNEDYSITKAYFNLVSSNQSVVVIEDGTNINVVGPGLALIRAFVGGVEATGTLTLNVLGSFIHAPTPTYPAANVISIFSDHYPNVPVDFYNGYWEPFQTTRSEDFDVDGDNVLNYVNFNFVGIQFSNPTINAAAMTHIHFDIFIPGAVDPNIDLAITLRDFGANGVDGGGDDSNVNLVLTNLDLVQGTWNGIDIPLAGLANKNAIGLIIYEGSNLPNFFVDNIFLYN
jgi:hypothetical protein